MQIYGTSSVYAALHLACGEYEEIHKLSIAQKQPADMVGGLFLVQIHVKQAEEASKLIDCQVDVMSTNGPGINLIVTRCHGISCGQLWGS